MKKRLFAALLCLIMVTALLPATAFAADGDATRVWIAGLELTSEKPYYHNGTNGTRGEANTTSDGANATFDPSTGTLTLNGLDVRNSTETQTITDNTTENTFTYAIFANGDLEINVTADSAISTANAAENVHNTALGVIGDVTFTGSAKLTATAGTGSSSNGVSVSGDLDISSGSLAGNAGESKGTGIGNSSVGVSVTGGLNISGGSLTATAATGNSSAGVFVVGNLNISGGSLTATAATGISSMGVAVAGNLSVSSGSLSATAGAGAISFGVTVKKSITVSNTGNLTGNSGAAGSEETQDAQSIGVYTNGSLTVSNTGVLTGTGNTATGTNSGTSAGVVSGAATVSGGSLRGKSNTATGKNARSYGAAVDGSLTVNGGSLTAEGDKAEYTGSEEAYTASFGIYAEADAIVFSGGTVTATGGESDNNSYGICAEAATVEFSGGTVTATGGTAEYYSLGIVNDGVRNNGNYVSGGAIAVSGTAIVNATGGTADGDNGSDSFGLWCRGDGLDVSGGTLTVKGGTANDDSFGIYAEAATIAFSGGTVEATGGKAEDYSIGINNDGIYDDDEYVSGGAITVSDTADVTAEGGEANDSFGLWCRGSSSGSEPGLDVSGGTLTATGGTANDDSLGINNDGIYDDDYVSGGAIEVSGSADVTAEGGAAYDSYGLWCRGSGLDVSGSGTLEAAGSTAKDDSYGIYVRAGDVTLNGKEVTAIGGEAVDSSYGVYAQDEATAISVSGGMFTAKATGTSSSTKAALNKALTNSNSLTALGSTASDGTDAVTYVGENNADYMWVGVNVVSTPTFSPAGGSYTSAQSVTLTCMPEGAAIYYTTDGSEPTSSSTLYNAATPIEAALGTTIKAKAFKDGMTESETASATYALPEPTQIVIPLTIPDPSEPDASEPDTSGPDTTEPDTTDPVQTEYIVLEGADGVWTTGSADGLTVIVDGDFEKFQSVSVDGEVIDSDKYTAEPGSTVVTLKAEYLQTLSAGSHTLRVNFTDGYAETTFTVAEGESVLVPQTGDSGSTALWTALMLMGCACAFTACASLRKMRRSTAK